MKSYSSTASSASQVPPSHRQSTPRRHHHWQDEQDTLRQPEKSHTSSTYTDDRDHDWTDYHPPPPFPFRPYNKNVSQHYHDRHSSPAPHNRERSRSPLRQARTNTGQTARSHLTGRHHDSALAASPRHGHH